MAKLGFTRALVVLGEVKRTCVYCGWGVMEHVGFGIPLQASNGQLYYSQQWHRCCNCGGADVDLLPKLSKARLSWVRSPNAKKQRRKAL